MTTNNVKTGIVNVVLEEMQLEQKELVGLRKNLHSGFFSYLNSEQADCTEHRKAVTRSFQSVFNLLDMLEEA